MSLFRYVLAGILAVYWAGICFLTHMPRPPRIAVDVGDKAAHWMAYGGLAVLLYLTLWVLLPRLRWTPLLVLAIILAYGALDEWTQPFFGRTCDFKDWLSDLGGVLMVIAVLWPAQWASWRWVAAARRSALPAGAGAQE